MCQKCSNYDISVYHHDGYYYITFDKKVAMSPCSVTLDNEMVNVIKSKHQILKKSLLYLIHHLLFKRVFNVTQTRDVVTFQKTASHSLYIHSTYD